MPVGGLASVSVTHPIPQAGGISLAGMDLLCRVLCMVWIYHRSGIPLIWSNHLRHRMSGTSINLKIGSCGMPLLGAFCRSAKHHAK
jgi:hypothetical protein